MAIAVDASTPAAVGGNADPWTTASFSPPAGSLLVCCVMADGMANPTLTPSSSGLTFTERVRRAVGEGGAQNGAAAIFTAPVASGGSRTVSVTTSAGSDEDNGGVKVWVLTGADTTTPVGATGEGSSTTNSITPTVLTTTADGSLVIGCAEDWNALGTPTSTDEATNATINVSGLLSGIAPRKAAATPTSGTGVTLNFDASGTGAAAWNWCAVEILAAAVSAPVFVPRVFSQYGGSF